MKTPCLELTVTNSIMLLSLSLMWYCCPEYRHCIVTCGDEDSMTKSVNYTTKPYAVGPVGFRHSTGFGVKGDQNTLCG